MDLSGAHPRLLLRGLHGCYFLYSVFGYVPENMDAPAWLELIVGVIALALILVPCAGADFYGWITNTAHDRRGLVPMVSGPWRGIRGVVFASPA